MNKQKPVLSALAGLALTLNAAVTTQANAEDLSEQQTFIEVMDGYLDLSRDVVELASAPETTIFLAVEGIVEIYEGRGQKADAVEHLQRIMQTHADNRVVKNIVRFKLKDIYVETGQPDKALQVLDELIQDNKG